MATTNDKLASRCREALEEFLNSPGEAEAQAVAVAVSEYRAGAVHEPKSSSTTVSQIDTAVKGSLDPKKP